jgi:hypothetical protein
VRPTALIADTRFKGISIGGTTAPYAPSAWGGKGVATAAQRLRTLYGLAVAWVVHSTALPLK